MAFSRKTCTVIVLVVFTVCSHLHEAHVIPARCSCLTTMKYIPDIISDFRVLEKRPGCDKKEVIVTVEKSDKTKEEICLNTEGRMAKAYLMCWTDRINKDESKKKVCLNRRKKTE